MTEGDAEKLATFEERVEVTEVFENDMANPICLGSTLLERDGVKILIPTPSEDPNDPLNWSQTFKIYVVLLLSLGVIMSNFLAAGPTVAIIEIAGNFTHPLNIPKTAYFFTITALVQGLGLALWMPLSAKYGRRPVLVFCYIGYVLSALWGGLSKQYGSELAARSAIGFFGGGAEGLAPVIITDIFFLHERGTYMSFYNVFLSVGVSGGIVFAALITHVRPWQYVYWVSVAVIGFNALLVLFTFPETAYRRDSDNIIEQKEKRSYWQRISLFTGQYTEEKLFKMFVRPAFTLLLPSVLWVTFVYGSILGFLVAVSSNFAVALAAPPYHFTSLQSGLCFIGGAVGALLSLPLGGHFGDWIADLFTRRNGGIREPEMRLPAMFPCIVLGPLGLLIYGLTIGRGLHWMGAVVALGLLNFSICVVTNVTIVYVVDIYKPIAAEVVVAILATKSVIGFVLSFYTNTWVEQRGYIEAFGTMTAISAIILSFTFLFYIWGANLRQRSFQWRTSQRMVKWHIDRDDGSRTKADVHQPVL
ncbi:hypothetical protein JAAARDRAFT_56925 [Jaapia argillacea MUCL 33604]|uniref:Major facilitator superfamily (MFS) profile domain-containing protein n=1 Tax=Jaapia argillacea MUCL 33604 TaxID=933084 RepID=A0A067Q8M2_9AGAM|nr:hypothetical protein JAAARDRAFT_56925 [Jaapia argillacea MUCL 33604]